MTIPRAFFVIGPAGSGKTSVARLLARQSGAAYIDKDTTCNRFTEALLEIAGTDKDERDNNPYYQSVVMDLGYQTILDIARDNLAVGRSVVLDAPFGRYFPNPDFLIKPPNSIRGRRMSSRSWCRFRWTAPPPASASGREATPATYPSSPTGTRSGRRPKPTSAAGRASTG
jgi:hypothetical protein